jgi:hypothetical protein
LLSQLVQEDDVQNDHLIGSRPVARPTLLLLPSPRACRGDDRNGYGAKQAGVGGNMRLEMQETRRRA